MDIHTPVEIGKGFGKRHVLVVHLVVVCLSQDHPKGTETSQRHQRV